MKITPLLSLLIFLLFGAYSIAQKPHSDITIAELKAHIEFLASDQLKGRQPGTMESTTSAKYLATQLKLYGYKLLGKKGFQHFDIIPIITAGDNNTFKFNDIAAILGTDFSPSSFTTNAFLKSDAVFAGYGFNIDTDSLKWNDYEGIDVKGKWVIIMRGDPEPDNLSSKFIRYSSDISKILTAKDKGAGGVILVSGSAYDEKDALPSLRGAEAINNAGIPVISVKRHIADKLLGSNGHTIASLEKQCNEKRQPASMPLAVTVEAATELIKQQVQSQNVVALLKGTHPTLKNEYIVIGAHYDHLGMGGAGSGSRTLDTLAVHNGADDNASGVAAILEIAGKLAANRQHLKRSILVVAFDAEEMGLLGSKQFVRNSPVPVNSIKAMLNFDMVGRLNPVQGLIIGGTGTAAEMEEFLTKHEADLPFKPSHNPDGMGPSDHSSFYFNNIPVLFLSTGAHDDYHTPDDDFDLINFEGLQSISTFGYQMTLDLLQNEKPLTFTESGSKQEMRSRRSFKVTLGIMPDVSGTSNDGLRVDGVKKEGPAGKAGIQKGDIITAIDGKQVKNIYEYMERLNKLTAGQLITVDVMREDKKIVILVQL
jgi:hypothetical protein